MNALAMPAWLPWLVLVGVIGGVAALYWLQPPPRKVIVASSLLWERVLRERPPGTDRLRWWLSLLLASVIAALIVSACLPVHRAAGGASEPAVHRLAVVIDDSATMSTRTTDGATRLQHAIADARTLIGSRTAGSEVWVADTMRRIATPAFLDRDDALAQLSRISAATGKPPALPLPLATVGLEIVVFTDGVSIGTLPERAKVQSVFEPVENAGIVAFDVRAMPTDARRYVAYVAIANAGGTRKSIELTVTGVGSKRVVRTLAIDSGATGREIIDVSDFAGGPVRASIAMAGDGLALDDVAYANLPEHRALRVALVTRGNPFLEKSLAAQPRVSLAVVDPARPGDENNYEAIVFDRTAPKTRPRVPALLILPGRADWLPPPLREVAGATASTWNASHPLLENVSLRDLGIDRASVFDLKDRAGKAERALASTSDGSPLIIASEDGPRWVALGFALEESNFALHAGFPVFLGNALDWMTTEQGILARGLGVIELPLPGARVLATDGSEVPTQAIPGGSIFEVQSPGLFTAVSAHGRARVTANLLDGRVTDVNRSSLPPFKPMQASAESVRMPAAIDTWFVLLLLSALLLLGEWWSWTRRLTV
ncbi:MAG: hypothetical protein ABI771_03210 [Betaproteobacteria bacterium]